MSAISNEKNTMFRCFQALVVKESSILKVRVFDSKDFERVRTKFLAMKPFRTHILVACLLIFAYWRYLSVTLPLLNHHEFQLVISFHHLLLRIMTRSVSLIPFSVSKSKKNTTEDILFTKFATFCLKSFHETLTSGGCKRGDRTSSCFKSVYARFLRNRFHIICSFRQLPFFSFSLHIFHKAENFDNQNAYHSNHPPMLSVAVS